MGDTITVIDVYPTAANKLGAIINVTLSGVDIHDYSTQISEYYFYSYGAPLNPSIIKARLVQSVLPADATTFMISNAGNVTIPLLVFEGFDSGNTLTLLDTSVTENDSIDISGLVSSLNPLPNNGGIYLGIAIGPTEYMFRAPEHQEIILNGVDHFLVRIGTPW